MLCRSRQKTKRHRWISTVQSADFGWLFAPVLSRLNPISVHSSSTAFFAVGFRGRNRHLSFFAILFHRFQVHFWSEIKEKIDALNGSM